MPGKNAMTSQNKEMEPTKNASSSEMQQGLKDTLVQLTEGLKSCLDDLWSLEINTMVVSDIGGHRFNPIHCYESIYRLPDDLDEFKKTTKPHGLRQATDN
jgi:hypothetical protein